MLPALLKSSLECFQLFAHVSIVPICGIILPNRLCPRSEWHYNNFRLLFGYRSCSASEMFVTNNNFEGRMRKHINDFTMRVGSSSSNILIATLRENSFIHAGPLRQQWVRSILVIILWSTCVCTVLCFMYCGLCIFVLYSMGRWPQIKSSYLILSSLYCSIYNLFPGTRRYTLAE